MAKTPKKAEKQIITVRVGTPKMARTRGYDGHSYVDIDCQERVSIRYSSLDDAIKELEDLRTKYSCEYTELSFDETRDCGCYGDCSCSPSTYLQGKRLESDLEFNLRIDKETRQAADRLERERKEFERLKKKFTNFLEA